MLDLIGYTDDRDLSSYKILEPSFGDGGFLVEIQHRLMQSAKRFNFDATMVMSHNVYGYEIDNIKYDKCVERLKLSMPDYEPLRLYNEDFLLSTLDSQFDFIIGNPPYIRYEHIPELARNIYKDKFLTFHYRCDLYVLFYEHCIRNLSKDGSHCFICSNRWLKNEYGKKLRAMISCSYNLDYVINVEEIEAFREKVLAYPAITLISHTKEGGDTKIASINKLQNLRLPISGINRKIVDMYNWDNLFLPEEIGNLGLIEHQGFNIGIGVATGADRLFISSKFKGMVEDELLMPIVNAKDLTGNQFCWKERYLLNPYTLHGSLVDLNKYPKAKQYLEENRAILAGRHIVRKGRKWYALIDRIKPDLVKEPKILLPDISGNDVVFVDYGFFYPAHNIYYITGKSTEDLEILASILMSNFIRGQLNSISNRMNGGMPRWQSQIIRKLRIPILSLIPSKQRYQLIEAYHNRDFATINALVERIVESGDNKSRKLENQTFPESLFDYDFFCQ